MEETKRAGYRTPAWLALGLWLVAGLVHAQEAPEASDVPLRPAEEQQLEAAGEAPLAAIRVEGNTRVEEERIREALGLRPGTQLTAERAAEALRSLFALGQFADVALSTEPAPGGGTVLVVRVEERPVLREVRFEGNEFLRREELLEVAALRPGEVLQPAELRQAALRLEALYAQRGFALVDVEPQVEPVPGEARVDVRFVVSERERVRVQQVGFTGELPLPEAQLREVVRTQPATVLTSLTGRGNLREDVIQADVAAVQSLLREAGYLQAEVAPVVTLSPENNQAYVTFQVTPGPRYTLASLSLEGDALPPEVAARVDLEEGGLLKPSQLGEDLEELLGYLRDEGHAFARVTPLTQLRPEAGEVDLRLLVNRGPQVCIGDIDVVGNVRTRPSVVLDTLPLQVGSPFTGTAVRQGQAALEALEIFEEVELAVQPADNPCGAQLVVRVKEAQTRYYRLGFGFAGTEKLLLTGLITDRNFLGRGLALSGTAQYSSRRASFEASLLEPSLLGTPASLRGEAFWTRVDLLDFEREALGAGAVLGYRFGAPLRDVEVGVGHALQDVELEAAPELAGVLPELDAFREGRLSVTRLSLGFDRLRGWPVSRQGFSAVGAVGYAPSWLGSEFQFIRYTLLVRGAVPLPGRLVLRASGNLGLIDPLAAEPLPLSELFFVGGIDSVRGYALRTLAPRVEVTVPTPEGGTETREVLVGGDKQVVLNLELEFPVAPRVGLSGLVFYDAGNAFAPGEPLFTDTAARLPLGLFQSVGVGLRWLSPLGLLRLEAGIPLNRRPGDRPVLLELAVGAPQAPLLR